MLKRVLPHWTECAIEAAALGAFMLSAATFAVLLYHPESPLAAAVPDGIGRRALMGLAMGATAISIIYSPWGQRSGAHMNPAVTLTFLRLRRVARHIGAGYVAAQFVGGVMGIAIAFELFGSRLSNAAVNFVATRPGSAGELVAFAAETAISFVLMLTVLTVSSNARRSRYTGLAAGLLVAAYITFEAPLSGMSMNPARTFGSALLARDFSALWIYFIAPPLGMLLAAEVFTLHAGLEGVACAKLHHPRHGTCIFGCDVGLTTKAADAAKPLRGSSTQPAGECRALLQGRRHQARHHT